MEASQLKIGIVGCGMAGIIMSAKLHREGIDFTVFEKSAQIGGPWYDAYFNQKMQVPVLTMQLYDELYSEKGKLEPDKILPADVYLSYLVEYISSREINKHIILNADVTNLSYLDDLKKWSVEYLQNTEKKKTQFDAIINCSGIFNSKHTPYSSLLSSSFSGLHFHSQDVKEMQILKGKRVVVIGAGKSAYDMTENCIDAGIQVAQVMKTPRWPVPFSLNIMKYRLLPEASVPYVKRSQIQRFFDQHPRLKEFYKKCFEIKTERMFSLSKLGIKPQTDIFLDWHCRGIVMQNSFYEKALNSTAKFYKGSITSVENTKITLDSGISLEADVVIEATGFERNFNIFEERFQQMLSTEMNSGGVFLFRDILHPKVPRCFFMNQFRGDSGTINSIQAVWISFFLKGFIQANTSLMEQDRQERKRHFMKIEPKGKDVSTFRIGMENALCEELATDLGFDFAPMFWEQVFALKNLKSFEKYRELFIQKVEDVVRKKRGKFVQGKNSQEIFEVSWDHS